MITKINDHPGMKKKVKNQKVRREKKAPVPSWNCLYKRYYEDLTQKLLGLEGQCRTLAAHMSAYDRQLSMSRTMVAPRILIVGSAGTGKTSLARIAAAAMCARIEATNLGLVTPAGYKGTNIGSAIARLGSGRSEKSFPARPRIFLVDEIDKIVARSSFDPWVSQLQHELLSVLGGEECPAPDDGSFMHSVESANVMVIACGVFNGVPLRSWRDHKSATVQLMKLGFSPEFCSRLTGVITLNKLTLKQTCEVVTREAAEIGLMYGIKKPDRQFCDSIGRKVYDHPAGLRAMRALIRESVLQQVT